MALGASAYYDFEDDQTGTTAAVQTAAGATVIGAATLSGVVAVPAAVPEPSSVAIMFGLGVAALVRRKRS